MPGGELPTDIRELCKSIGEHKWCGVFNELDCEARAHIKFALLARNQHFLGKCFANDCNKIVDNKSTCKNCDTAKYCSQECAVFDVAHKRPHPIYTEITPCVAIETLSDIVVEPSASVWDPFTKDPDFYPELISYN